MSFGRMDRATQLPVLDSSALEALSTLGTAGDGDSFADIVGLFRDDLPESLAALFAALARGDREEVQRASHSLRGSGGQLGLLRLSALAGEIEDAAQKTSLVHLRDRAVALGAEVDIAVRALDERRQSPAEPEGSAPSTVAQPSRVLVVDDERHMVRFVQFVLSGAGYRVTCAHDGEEALDAVARVRPDAIVLDLVMPGMSGFEVLSRLRGLGQEMPPVIVLTARAGTTTSQEVSAAGASAHCAKPVAPTTLLRTLARLGIPPQASGGEPTSSPSRAASVAGGSLLSEMAVGWEALEALYELAAVAATPGGARGVTQTLLGRLRRVDPGLEAAFWVEGDARASTGLAAPDPSCGLLGLALRHRHSVILEGRAAVLDLRGSESELRGARAALAVPFETPSGLRGALLAWRRFGTDRLDTRLTRLMESLAGQAAALLENARLHDAQLAREQLEQELAIGERIQRALLFSEPPTDIPGLHCAALWKPSHGVGGDFFDFLPLGNGSLDIVLGDVMGKGVPAALLGAAAKSHLLRSFAACGATAAPEALVQGAAERLMSELVEIESFVTLCYARFEVSTGRLRLVNAGHTRTLRVREGRAEALAGDNLPLGFRATERYQARTIETLPGDLFLFYSDGVTETRDADGELLGEDGLARWLEGRAFLTPPTLVAALRSMLEKRCGRLVPEDDVTAVCVKVSEEIGEGRLLFFRSDAVPTEAVREFAVQACRAAAVPAPEEACAAVALALHETISNVAEHAYPGERGRIEIRAESEGGTVILSVIHDGAPFDRGAVKVPVFDGSCERGFGIFLAEAAMDRVSYTREADGRHCIRLARRIAPGADPDKE
jgi:phosphoserine phosphatase RsbU/P